MRDRDAMIDKKLDERINAPAAADLPAGFRSMAAGSTGRARPALGDYDFLADCVAFACACRLIINHDLLHGLSRILCGFCR